MRDGEEEEEEFLHNNKFYLKFKFKVTSIIDAHTFNA
jgi:hypothetical protein